MKRECVLMVLVLSLCIGRLSAMDRRGRSAEEMTQVEKVDFIQRHVGQRRAARGEPATNMSEKTRRIFNDVARMELSEAQIFFVKKALEEPSSITRPLRELLAAYVVSGYKEDGTECQQVIRSLLQIFGYILKLNLGETVSDFEGAAIGNVYKDVFAFMQVLSKADVSLVLLQSMPAELFCALKESVGQFFVWGKDSAEEKKMAMLQFARLCWEAGKELGSK